MSAPNRFGRRDEQASWVKQRANKPPEVTLLDHQIGLREGTSIALEATPQRLQMGKSSSPLDDRVRLEDVTRDNGYLRVEIQFYRDCFECAQRFHLEVGNICQQLQVAYYQDVLQAGDSLEYCDELCIDLRHAMERYIDDQRKAEKSWLEFFGPPKIGADYDGRL